MRKKNVMLSLLLFALSSCVIDTASEEPSSQDSHIQASESSTESEQDSSVKMTWSSFLRQIMLDNFSCVIPYLDIGQLTYDFDNTNISLKITGDKGYLDKTPTNWTNEFQRSFQEEGYYTDTSYGIKDGLIAHCYDHDVTVEFSVGENSCSLLCYLDSSFNPEERRWPFSFRDAFEKYTDSHSLVYLDLNTSSPKLEIDALQSEKNFTITGGNKDEKILNSIRETLTSNGYEEIDDIFSFTEEDGCTIEIKVYDENGKIKIDVYSRENYDLNRMMDWPNDVKESLLTTLGTLPPLIYLGKRRVNTSATITPNSVLIQGGKYSPSLAGDLETTLSSYQGYSLTSEKEKLDEYAFSRSYYLKNDETSYTFKYHIYTLNDVIYAEISLLTPYTDKEGEWSSEVRANLLKLDNHLIPYIYLNSDQVVSYYLESANTVYLVGGTYDIAMKKALIERFTLAGYTEHLDTVKKTFEDGCTITCMLSSFTSLALLQVQLEKPSGDNQSE